MINKEVVVFQIEDMLSNINKENLLTYGGHIENGTAFLELMTNVLALLKEQEPKPPIVHENSYGWKFYYCPNCEKEFYQNRKQAYCEKCGQAVRWE